MDVSYVLSQTKLLRVWLWNEESFLISFVIKVRNVFISVNICELFYLCWDGQFLSRMGLFFIVILTVFSKKRYFRERKKKTFKFWFLVQHQFNEIFTRLTTVPWNRVTFVFEMRSSLSIFFSVSAAYICKSILSRNLFFLGY